MGGLGNQLFQYAFAHYLIRRGVAVTALCVAAYDKDSSNAFRRSFLLGAVSSLPITRAAADDARGMLMASGEDGDALVEFLLAEQNRHGQWLCNGYWQNHAYVEAVGDQIRQDLLRHRQKSFPRSSSESDSAPVECVLHVRRSNYGQNGLLPVSYYLACLEECGWPDFRVVTDEANFCTAMFRSVKGFRGIVSNSQADPWQDFFFLAGGQTQIIANSSFSWWSAWLGRACGLTARIFAPTEWSIMTGNDPCPADWSRTKTALLRP